MQKIPTCWYLWRWVTQIFCVLPDAKPKSCVLPDVKPNASQWNIGCVGSQPKMLALAMYISLFLVSISFTLGPVSQWNMGFRILHHSAEYFTADIQGLCSHSSCSLFASKLTTSNGLNFLFVIILFKGATLRLLHFTVIVNVNCIMWLQNVEFYFN